MKTIINFLATLFLLGCHTVTGTDAVTTIENIGGTDQFGGPGWVLPKVEAPNLEYHLYQSSVARSDVSYQVFVPDEYAAHPGQTYPVLYWLHGSGGGNNALAWQSTYFGDAIRSGKIPAMLIVFPNGLSSGMWVDSKDGRTPIETMVIKELIPEIDARFRTITSRNGRMVEGFSMGGYGAARFGFKYPELFRAISILGGGPLQKDFSVTPRASEQTRDLILDRIYGGSYDYFIEQSPWNLAGQHDLALRSNTLIRQVVGDADETLPANQELDARLTDLQIPHSLTVLPGVEHAPTDVLTILGDSNSNWTFYRAVWGVEKDSRFK